MRNINMKEMILWRPFWDSLFSFSSHGFWSKEEDFEKGAAIEGTLPEILGEGIQEIHDEMDSLAVEEVHDDEVLEINLQFIRKKL